MRSRTKQAGALEERLGHTFNDRALLTLALTHRSFAYESRDSEDEISAPGRDNEQLEFVGDAVLGLIVAEALWREFPASSEGELTRLRASLVSRKSMADFGRRLGLGEFLTLGRSAEQAGGRNKPALLSNAAEAIVAAVYLDGGLEATRRLIEQEVIAPQREQLRLAVAGTPGGALRDHKTLLQERVQAEVAGKLRYVDVDMSGPPHQRTFRIEAHLEKDGHTRVLSTAEGATKKEAQQRAAELALEHWPGASR